MQSISVVFAVLLTFVLCSDENENPKIISEMSNTNEWDVLIFTQHWPTTVCYQWKEKEDDHSCALPSQKDIWTVHGIWPTKLGTIGPQFCNSSQKFDPAQLAPIEAQLDQFWINIEKGTPHTSFWKHEWTKHGTCASVLSQLNTEQKYFSMGLQWLQQYSMTTVLAKAGILPNSVHHPAEIYAGIKNVLQKNPALECMHDSKSGLSYMFEIRICFDKKLQLTDCNGIKSIVGKKYNSFGDDIITNCVLAKPVVYPSIVPVPPKLTSSQTYQWPWINIYKLVHFIQWFTF